MQNWQSRISWGTLANANKEAIYLVYAYAR